MSMVRIRSIYALWQTVMSVLGIISAAALPPCLPSMCPKSVMELVWRPPCARCLNHPVAKVVRRTKSAVE
uniref:Putative secreted protein n=1 Tax=Anopheles darlingi TaxID=43151 RepID=A0A2M4DBV5_ANODA